jgi:hypothetical protein
MTKKDVDRIRYLNVPTTNAEETIYLKKNEVITKIFVEALFNPLTDVLKIHLDNLSIVFNQTLQNYLPFTYEVTLKTSFIKVVNTNEYMVILEITTLEEERE